MHVTVRLMRFIFHIRMTLGIQILDNIVHSCEYDASGSRGITLINDYLTPPDSISNMPSMLGHWSRPL